MDQMLFGIGLVIIVIALATAFRHRYNTTQCIGDIMAGIFFSTFFMILPTAWISEGETVSHSWGYRILSSLFYSFKALGGGPDIVQLESVKLTGAARDLYFAVNYILFAVAPVLTSGLILSLFGDIGEKIRYWLNFSENVHVFSELNENAIALAKGIRKRKGRQTVVFCGTKEADKSDLVKARRLHGITLYTPCENLRPGLRHRHYHYYLISGNEDKNLNTAMEMLARYRKAKAGKVTVNAFSGSGTDIRAVESMDCGNIRLRFIDNVALFCNNLMFEHPLYRLPEGVRDISVLVVGCGRTGLQIIRTAAWCGQINGYTLRIRAIDKNAAQMEKEFFALCPELAGKEYDIRFEAIDVLSADFEDYLLQSGKMTYAVVTMGDDEINIGAADKLRARSGGSTIPLKTIPRSLSGCGTAKKPAD